jgi:hypothetical protein
MNSAGNSISGNAARNLNSLLPLGVPAANVINTLKTNVAKLNNQVNRVVNQVSNASGVTATAGKTALGIFSFLVVVFLILLYFFHQEIRDGYNVAVRNIREFLGYPVAPFEMGEMKESVLIPIKKPHEESPKHREASEAILEKVLPDVGSSPEVYNISKNTFTFYDAEPLCKALGAELATYDQVKQAWDRGADWCNYGWVKGQAAVYPTQKGTWEKLQSGPEEQRLACGRPGMNGGYFDNPELRFGVNCYGPKPSQSSHDAALRNKGAPSSPAQLEFEKKVAKYRTKADTIGIMPFNTQKWSLT